LDGLLTSTQTAVTAARGKAKRPGSALEPEEKKDGRAKNNLDIVNTDHAAGKRDRVGVSKPADRGGPNYPSPPSCSTVKKKKHATTFGGNHMTNR